MSNSVRLEVGSTLVTVYPLRKSRAVCVTKVAITERHTWALDAKGRLLCSDISSLKQAYTYPPRANVYKLRDEDVVAIEALGKINAEEVKKARDEAIFNRHYNIRASSLRHDAECLTNAGVMLPKNWEKTIDQASRDYAEGQMEKDKERRKRK